jgi:hypothetical protein
MLHASRGAIWTVEAKRDAGDEDGGQLLNRLRDGKGDLSGESQCSAGGRPTAPWRKIVRKIGTRDLGTGTYTIMASRLRLV